MGFIKLTLQINNETHKMSLPQACTVYNSEPTRLLFRNEKQIERKEAFSKTTLVW